MWQWVVYIIHLSIIQYFTKSNDQIFHHVNTNCLWQTRTERITVWALPSPWAHKCQWLTSVIVIDRAGSATLPFLLWIPNHWWLWNFWDSNKWSLDDRANTFALCPGFYWKQKLMVIGQNAFNTSFWVSPRCCASLCINGSVCERVSHRKKYLCIC